MNNYISTKDKATIISALVTIVATLLTVTLNACFKAGE